MGLVRLGLAVLLLSGCFLGTAHAQWDDSAQQDESQLPPTDYGAGYKLVVFHQHQEHVPGAGDDKNGQSPITLDKTYPLIASPLTAEARAFNSKIQQMSAKWWPGPHDNSTRSDPDTHFKQDCEPVGLAPPPEVEALSLTGHQMLPGVISAACETYSFTIGYPHGEGNYWGFNWLMEQRREIQASDVFDMKTAWLKALTVAANAGRNVGFNGVQYPLDFSDTTHWVVTAQGLGLIYRDSAFLGFLEGGGGTFYLIPWSELAPYLRKDGIVPQCDWSMITEPGLM